MYTNTKTRFTNTNNTIKIIFFVFIFYFLFVVNNINHNNDNNNARIGSSSSSSSSIVFGFILGGREQRKGRGLMNFTFIINHHNHVKNIKNNIKNKKEKKNQLFINVVAPTMKTTTTITAASKTATTVVQDNNNNNNNNNNNINNGIKNLNKEFGEDKGMDTYARYPVVIEKGKGSILQDTNGKEYLDFVAGIATTSLGHSNKMIGNIITKQMNKIQHISNVFFTKEQYEFACNFIQSSCGDKVFFCNSGAEANEAAIKLARKYGHEKLHYDIPIILTARNSFHGRTLATITATGQEKYRNNYGPFPEGFDYFTYNNINELKEKVKEINNNNNNNNNNNIFSRVKGIIMKNMMIKPLQLSSSSKKELLKKGVTAIMLETIQGEGGVRIGNHDFFKEVRELCDEIGALLIIDEVQTGVGRTGKLWGYQNLGIEPDIMTSAKGLGGGIPIGAMVCKEKCNIYKPGDHGSTFGGNPLACKIANSVLTKIKEENFLKSITEKGNYLRELLYLVQNRFPDLIYEIRGWGLLNGIEVSSSTSASDIVKLCTENGLLLVSAGPNVIRMIPPLTISKTEILKAVKIFESALSEINMNLTT